MTKCCRNCINSIRASSQGGCKKYYCGLDKDKQIKSVTHCCVLYKTRVKQY